ncbi:MAG: CPBP family intramembrane metalloprotease [Oscillospiraceae bacterium]|jgi:membrane protease YdiL (CAAX protease family)|nr:CPBP family intramembrane metalloprotease [Oscillospiraceae bacterium]
MEEPRMVLVLRRQEIRKTFGRVAWGLMLFFILQSIIVAIPSVVAELAGLSFLQADWVMWGGMLVSFLIALVILQAFLKGLPDWGLPEDRRHRLSVKHMLLILLVCFGFMYAANYATALLTLLLQPLRGEGASDLLENLLGGEGKIYALLYAVLAGPVLEELLFRGLLYKKLVRFGGQAYIFYSALLFALFHFNFAQLFYAFLLGLVFAAVMYYTGKILYSIVLHVIVNFVGGAVPIILDSFESAVPGKVYTVFTLVMIVAGLSVFFVWLKSFRKEAARRKALATMEANGDATFAAAVMRAESKEQKQPLFYLDFPPRAEDFQAPTKKEMLSNGGFIVFAVISVVGMIGMFFGIMRFLQ